MLNKFLCPAVGNHASDIKTEQVEAVKLYNKVKKQIWNEKKNKFS
jgi:hypothetical protein